MFRTMSFASLKRIGLLLALALASTTPAAAQQAAAPARTGQQVYETICITCHGPGGSGGVNLELEKVIELPDFSDCSLPIASLTATGSPLRTAAGRRAGFPR